MSDGELKSRWKNWLGHRDERIAFEAFKLALSYLYGKPVQPVVGEELAPPIKIDISEPFRPGRTESVAALGRRH